MIPLEEGLRRLHDRMAATGLPVMVGGSVAAMWWGEPRSTLDIDLVVQAGRGDAERIRRQFLPEEEFYLPPLEHLRDELARGAEGSFNVIDLATGLKADVYPAGSDPLIAYGFANAVAQQVGGSTLRLAPPTYVVAMKLRYHSLGAQDKHLRDIRSILALSPGAVDQAEVARWARTFGAEKAWAECLAGPGRE